MCGDAGDLEDRQWNHYNKIGGLTLLDWNTECYSNMWCGKFNQEGEDLDSKTTKPC